MPRTSASRTSRSRTRASRRPRSRSPTRSRPSTRTTTRLEGRDAVPDPRPLVVELAVADRLLEPQVRERLLLLEDLTARVLPMLVLALEVREAVGLAADVA